MVLPIAGNPTNAAVAHGRVDGDAGALATGPSKPEGGSMGVAGGSNPGGAWGRCALAAGSGKSNGAPVAALQR